MSNPWTWQIVCVSARPPHGELSLYHRPSAKEIKALAEDGCNVVVTIQDGKEQADEVGKAVRANGMEWIWLPSSFRRRSFMDLPRKEVLSVIQDIQIELVAGNRVMIHCAEGKDRSGIIAAAVLYSLDFDDDEVKDTVVAIRPAATRGLGKEGYLTWASWIGHQVIWATES